jgi:hypothetical protein
MKIELVGQYQASARSWAYPFPAGFITVRSPKKIVVLTHEFEPVAQFTRASSTRSVPAVAPDLASAAVLHRDRVTLVSQKGRELWSLSHSPWGNNGSESGCCAFSHNGTLLWVVVPDSPNAEQVPLRTFPFSTDGSDQLWIVDVATGDIITKAQLSCNGAGGSMVAHPDHEWIGIGIGEGQDGSNIYWARFENRIENRIEDRLRIDQLADTSRILIDVHPNGTSFLTTPQEQDVIQVHAFPSGKVLAELANDLDEAEFFDFDACYIDDRSALLKVTNGEDDSTRFVVVDAETLSILGPLEPSTDPRADLQDQSIACGLGDGTWLTLSWPDAMLTRWRLEEQGESELPGVLNT